MHKPVGSMIILIIILMAGCGTGNTENTNDQNISIPSHVDYDEDDYSSIVKPNNELAFELLKNVKPDQDENLFISPTSVMMALSMVYNGADGHTKQAIAKALQTDKLNRDNLNKANAALIDKLADRSHVQLNLANSIWINDTFSLDEDFQKNTQDHYNAEVDPIDVADPSSADQINQWVEDATEDKITDMVDSPLDDNLVALLINAIYFKGDWKYEFNVDLTEEHPFQTDENKSVDVPLMTMNKELNYMENDHVQTVELPYDNDEMSMRVMLPKDDMDLNELKETLTYDTLLDWQDELTKTEGTIALPKFSLDYEVDLNDPLSELGMAQAFSKDKADFSKMIQDDSPVWIDQVKQKSFIEVNEEGTEAAAATSTEVKTTSLDPNAFQMIVDRPFLFTITDNQTNTILFIGAISNPPKIDK